MNHSLAKEEDKKKKKLHAVASFNSPMIHCLNAAVMYYYTTDTNLDIAQVNHTKRELHNVFIRKLYR